MCLDCLSKRGGPVEEEKPAGPVELRWTLEDGPQCTAEEHERMTGEQVAKVDSFTSHCFQLGFNNEPNPFDSNTLQSGEYERGVSSWDAKYGDKQ